jgi:hypothetical protein
MTNRIIMKLLRSKNTQENAEKHKESLGNAIHFIGMDRLIFTSKGNENLLKQQHVSRALPPSVLAV